MSSENAYLALRLQGPLQAWGFDSQYNRRNTGLFPTKSGIAGMCCAALGYPRGGDKEQAFLASFGLVRMMALSIPRPGMKKDLPVRRLQDYHTVQNTRRANGTINNDCVLTHRQYLMDAAFGIILEGNRVFLGEIAVALSDPKWGIWLGRKSCIPSSPVFAGIKDTCEAAVSLLIGNKNLESFTRQIEVVNFTEGQDSIPDAPISFAKERRVHCSLRRVRTIQGKDRH